MPEFVIDCWMLTPDRRIWCWTAQAWGCSAKHGRLRRRWLKLHLGVDATTGEIAAHLLTDGDEDNAAQVPDLLRQCESAIASLGFR